MGGPGDSHFRWVDLILLGFLSLAMFRIMRPFGYLTAWISCAGFAYIYLSFGPGMSLQRDYLGALLVALSLALVPRTSGCRNGMYFRYACIAMIFSYASLIKPQFIIGAPVVFLLAFSMDAARSWPRFFRATGVAALFFFLPILLVCGWLWQRGALDDFLFMVLEYLPLYQAQTGAHVFLPEGEWWPYLWHNTWKMYHLKPLFFLALAGCGLAFRHAVQQADHAFAARVAAIAGLFLLFAVYPTISGKFWDYHYIPFCLFAALAAGLILHMPAAGSGPARGGGRLVVLAVFLLLLNAMFPFSAAAKTISDAWRFKGPDVDRNVERADLIAQWLKNHAEPGDRIQTMTWIDSGVHALLLSKAITATRFMLDFHFYHHVGSPVNNRMRNEYLAALRNDPPDYFVVIPNRKRVRGFGTTDRFPELYAFVRDQYTPALILPDLEIYRFGDQGGVP